MREEKDSIGVLKIDKDAYYGIQSLRGSLNFNVIEQKNNHYFIKNIARIKKAAAKLNFQIGLLNKSKFEAISKAADEIIDGKFYNSFIVDSIQGGAGTSLNMNANEVIANRAIEILGGVKGDYSVVHPNDDVNMSQSTNDVIPSAAKMTVIDLINPLLVNLNKLEQAFLDKSVEFDDVIKMGRTQMQDAVPIRLGQEFRAYASAVKRDIERISTAVEKMHELNVGGPAIGTSVNVNKEYLENIAEEISSICGYNVYLAENLIDSTQNFDRFVNVSSSLKTCAVNMAKIAGDLCLMSSGPRTGFLEINLPPMQNGSSIMPGKVNPTQCEAVTMVAVQVMGNDVAVGMAASQGNFELNVFMPVCIYNFLQSARLLSEAIVSFNDNCAVGIKANREKMDHNLHNSLMLVTALNPYIGYENAAKTAKKAYKDGVSLKQACVELGFLTAEKFDEVFHPENMV